MRLEEICQLRLEDVYKEGTVDIIRVTLSKDTKLKNVGSQRIIPIHDSLKKLGFLDYCNYLRKQKKERVFWDLSKGRDGYGRNIGRYFMGYLRQVGVYEFQSKVFHSLRHTFITNLLQNAVREEVVNGLCGHKQKTMSTTIYFKGGFPPDLLYEEGISKLEFEGMNFGKLKIDWKKLIG
jgi:integrase